jgi:hypothetical protein
VRIQVIQHDLDALRLREVNVHELFHLLGEISFRPTFGDFDMPPARQRFQAEEQVGGSLPFVFIILPSS